MPITPELRATLEATSRTFFIPISRLPDGLQDAVAASYLCLRALDEIEDHPELPAAIKSALLRGVSDILQASSAADSATSGAVGEQLAGLFAPHAPALPAVTLQLGEWLAATDEPIAPRIWDATAAAAERMALWAERGWTIESQADLDHYTYSVAGAVGLLLCDLWAWYGGNQLDRQAAVRFGRGLQAVNILRNRADDQARGVDFFPSGWGEPELDAYAERNLRAADDYFRRLQPDAFSALIEIPLTLAHATLEVLRRGERKLSRPMVVELVRQVGERPGAADPEEKGKREGEEGGEAECEAEPDDEPD
jgi:farnesyl-diphosphate farnesyltransferase